MHLGANPDSVVPTGLDLGATLIPGLKPGAIFFRPCGTQFARGATTCPRSDRMGSHGGLPLQGETDARQHDHLCAFVSWYEIRCNGYRLTQRHQGGSFWDRCGLLRRAGPNGSTPDQNGDMVQAPSPARLRVPVRTRVPRICRGIQDLTVLGDSC